MCYPIPGLPWPLARPAPGLPRLLCPSILSSPAAASPEPRYVSPGQGGVGKPQLPWSAVCVPKPFTARPSGSGPGLVDLGRAAAPRPLTPAPTSLQEAGKLEEVMQELRALRALVKEQGERIGRLEEQLGRMENGDA